MNFLLSHNLMYTLLLAILVSFRCKCPLVKSTALSIETDKEALIEIKSRLEPHSLSSWNQSASPCSWTGVFCNKLNHRVLGLNLSSLGVSGSISPYIGNLSFLQSLELQNNQLTGIIPDEICNLSRLRVMNMNSNNLRGSILPNISKLSELRVLDLSMNRITGKITDELSSLTKLQVLNLGRNAFSGTIPPSLANLSSLEDLILGTNTLSGIIPSDLSRLHNLKVLDLTINNLTGIVPSKVYNMSSLVNLALASNQLWGKLPSDVGVTLPNLLDFNLCFNKFTGLLPGSLHNLTNIHIIRVAHNLLEGKVPPGLENLPFLEMYNIGFNNFVGYGDKGLDFITSLTNSSRLKFLAFDGNLLQGVIPESVGNLSKNLSKLYMGGNQIYGGIPASIGHLSSLTLLNLSYNSITGSIPREIGQLEHLQFLGLAGNQFSGSIPDSLGNLRKLNQIDLSRNGLVGAIPTTFGNFQSLLAMDLSNNKLNGSIAKEILNLPSLSKILNLSNNFLSGNLSEDIGLLESVVTIDLSNNHLSGDIPSLIKNCESLEELYMSRNSFSGPVPAVLGEMKGLETLDLSYNHLSGFIPPDLQKLEALQLLNLAFNDLEGAVPCGGVFTNISKVHLEGNTKLSLELSCKNPRSRRANVVKISIVIAVTATLAFCLSIGYLLFIRRSKGKIEWASNNLIKEQHQIVSYRELRQATDNFAERNLIGSGGFGSVYKGFLVDGSAVAVKVLDIKQTGCWKSFVAECEALRNVRHRNLVKLITSCSSIDFKNVEFLALVYEFLGNGSLDDWIKGKRKKENGDGLNLMERLNVVIDAASAMDYLHYDCEVPVVHCDLKPSNVLLKEDMTAKVGDFGLATLLVEKIGVQTSISSTHVLKGSIGYIPPEYGLGVKPSTAGDVYSFGVMLLELFTGKSPTCDSFKGEQNLVGWVQSAFSSNILQVLDPVLLLPVDNWYHDDQSIISEIQNDCLITVCEVGLSCTAESPDRRISMRDALLKLKAARDNLLNYVPNYKVKCSP
ncbi:serine-threonine protein kinase, plant-type, putative [Ricinus communis]|uniref:non-specific serine/threonine protein kinase n=1 Tax=Ricinus communis TaxID=3988 RepID=B9SN92_RICCO|nr:serine-threonine protein kinase, plant-type, putative [Ricinus communis]|eukprot:XP_002527461.1 putative receptor-like protein kinase At3g47110 [Ricinus communis]